MDSGGKWVVAAGCLAAGFVVGLVAYAPRPGRSTPPATAPRRSTALPDATPSALRVLAVGVSRYADPSLDLRYARADAEALAALLEAQAGGALYGHTESVVLTDADASLSGLATALAQLLARAGPADVIVLFFAGHGVRDPSDGRYYFLTHEARLDDLPVTALPLGSLEGLIQGATRQVRALVVLLDTCHSGALRLPAPAEDLADPADPVAAGVLTGRGVYVLGATRPSEDSQERATLAHGAFTDAILRGLGGMADTNADAVLTVSEVFGYVTREVTRETGGMQHPYSRLEGTDLTLVALPAETQGTPAARSGMDREAADPPSDANALGVVPFDNLSADPEYAWLGEAIRLAFNTELSKVRALHVFAPELIDERARAGGGWLRAARQLRIGRLITGSFSVVGRTVRIDARIVNVTTGLQEGSDSVEGDVDRFFELQKRLVLSLLQRLRVRITQEEGESIEAPTNTDIDAYRLLLESQEAFDATPAPDDPPSTPHARLPEPSRFWQRFAGASRRSGLWSLPWLGVAQAQQGEGGDSPLGPVDPATLAEVTALLEDFRTALERGDLDRLEALYAHANEQRREVQRTYLDNASGLQVELVEVDVTPHPRGAVATYTRRDRFVDRGTGKEQRLEVRLTRLVVRDGTTWKIGGKP